MTAKLTKLLIASYIVGSCSLGVVAYELFGDRDNYRVTRRAARSGSRRVKYSKDPFKALVKR